MRYRPKPWFYFEKIQDLPKLRTYKLFKSSFKTEEYVTLNIRKNERSLLAQLRMGILPLRIETGRYVGEPLERRICRLCQSGQVENETHFLFECGLYCDLRAKYFSDVNVDLSNLDLNNKLKLLMTSYPRKLAKFIVEAYLKRRRVVYA